MGEKTPHENHKSSKYVYHPISMLAFKLVTIISGKYSYNRLCFLLMGEIK